VLKVLPKGVHIPIHEHVTDEELRAWALKEGVGLPLLLPATFGEEVILDA
jgi:hypothetical protein